jgi:hypothetical protein
MKKKFTFPTRIIASIILILSALIINSITAKTFAQISCNNETVLFLETFGTGTTATSSPDVLPSGLTYQETGPLANEGVYRIINNTQQKPEWHASEDRTANDIDGKMLVTNGQAEVYYMHRIDRVQGFVPGNYTASIFLMNLNTLGTCGAEALIPNITFTVEYLSQANTWEPLNGSPYLAPPVVQTASPTWVQVGSSFTLPSTGNLVTSIRIVLSDGTVGGCGNDFAMDDVKFSLCPEGGPLPVEFLKINARQKGSGVSVEWSTSQEFNSKYFTIEKSADGNINWTAVASINAAGNSSIVKNYNAYDPTPFKGINYYRIKQVDLDGHFKYSKIVSVKLNLNKTGISVLANPFHNILTVDLSSETDQLISARLVDITGKQVAAEKWSIGTGSTRKDFSNISGLQQGMYILTIRNAGGEILYNNKVIKQ